MCVGNGFLVSIYAPISHSASFVLGIVLLKDLVSTFQPSLSLHKLLKSHEKHSTAQHQEPIIFFSFVPIIYKTPSVRPPAMKCSNIIASALVHLATLAYAAPAPVAAVEARQEFEVSITFTGEGSSYFQQFPTDNQPYPIGKSSPQILQQATYPFILRKDIRKRTLIFIP